MKSFQPFVLRFIAIDVFPNLEKLISPSDDEFDELFFGLFIRSNAMFECLYKLIKECFVLLDLLTKLFSINFLKFLFVLNLGDVQVQDEREPRQKAGGVKLISFGSGRNEMGLFVIFLLIESYCFTILFNFEDTLFRYLHLNAFFQRLVYSMVLKINWVSLIIGFEKIRCQWVKVKMFIGLRVIRVVRRLRIGVHIVIVKAWVAHLKRKIKLSSLENVAQHQFSVFLQPQLALCQLWRHQLIYYNQSTKSTQIIC